MLDQFIIFALILILGFVMFDNVLLGEHGFVDSSKAKYQQG